MKDEYKFNLIQYLIFNNKKCIFVAILIVFILISLVTSSFIIRVFDIEKVTAQVVCENNACTLNFYNIGLEKNNFKFVKIKEDKYYIENLVLSEPKLNADNIAFQEVSLKLKSYQGLNNEIVELKMYKNKEILIKKIFKIIIER